MKSLYYQFVSNIQNLDGLWFATIWMAFFALSLICVLKFFKHNDGTKKNFEKPSFIFLAVIFIAILMWITFIRK